MSTAEEARRLFSQFVVEGNHAESEYFPLIREFVKRRGTEGRQWQPAIDQVYALLLDEILNNQNGPVEQVKFGTSGWRGHLGKDVCVHTVACVTAAIVELYKADETEKEILDLLGIAGYEDAQRRGCVVGFDNRFAGEVLARVVVDVLNKSGFVVHYAGETTTGVLSAAVLELNAAFSINLTPSHNPLDYGGFKYNAADGGPAASGLTEKITENARRLIKNGLDFSVAPNAEDDPMVRDGVHLFDSLATWKKLVERNYTIHGISLSDIMDRFSKRDDMTVAVDSVHGASRLHIRELLPDSVGDRLTTLRDTADVTFGGIAPEPSSKNIKGVVAALKEKPERLKLGAIIDPDGDRIRFTDGTTEISMNQFGAMAYHFLHEYKGKKGMVAKTVATSNMANRLAEVFGEELFEPRVGFKEFKPVIGKALVYFEESDGISIIGHTPEKDAYIGLMLALDMVMTTNKNLGEYLRELEGEYGAYYPDRDGIEVSVKGQELLTQLARLEKYGMGSELKVGEELRKITEVITIDGRKMIFEDGSWIMIRPSGTEPKVRFYVESRTSAGTVNLVDCAREMLKEIDLL